MPAQDNYEMLCAYTARALALLKPGGVYQTTLPPDFTPDMGDRFIEWCEAHGCEVVAILLKPHVTAIGPRAGAATIVKKEVSNDENIH